MARRDVGDRRVLECHEIEELDVAVSCRAIGQGRNEFRVESYHQRFGRLISAPAEPGPSGDQGQAADRDLALCRFAPATPQA